MQKLRIKEIKHGLLYSSSNEAELYHIPREMQISLEKDKMHQEIGEM